MIHYKYSQWNNLNNLGPESFVCGFCGDKIGSSHGYFLNTNIRIYICTNCGRPTFFDSDDQFPGPKIGKEIKNLPDDIQKVYDEIRSSIKEKNYSAASLLGRKLLMHLAVDKAESKEGLSFAEYVDKLKPYIPPGRDKWLKRIKDLGNEKNHELKLGEENECIDLFKFIELLLQFFYEYGMETEEDSKSEK